MADDSITYLRGYHAVRTARRAELMRVQRQISDLNPLPRVGLGCFFFAFGGVLANMVPPLGAVGLLVGVICCYTGVRMGKARRELRSALADDEFRWNLRDTALAKLGERQFETLAKSVEAQGSYASVTGWMKRKAELSDDECDALILAAVVAADERRAMGAALTAARTRTAMGGATARESRRKLGTDADSIAAAQHERAFGSGGAAAPGEPEPEGMHARLMREAEADAASPAMPPPRREHPGTAAPAPADAGVGPAAIPAEPADSGDAPVVSDLEARIAAAEARKRARRPDADPAPRY